MNTNSPGFLVHAASLMLATFLIVALSRAFSQLVPLDFYFTFESLFSDRTPRMIVITLAAKMSAPLIVGACFGFCLYRRSVRGPDARLRFSRMARRLRTQWTPTLFLAGFNSALLAAWPMIVYWDLFANPELAHLKPVFFLLYLLYMIAFGYVALFGLLGSIYLLEQLDGLPKGKKAVSTGELSRVGILWLLTSGLASGAAELITK